MMNECFVRQFERKTAAVLTKILPEKTEGSRRPVIAAAVSGGPDSMALLTVLFRLKEKLKTDIRVITIDHNIRPPEQSAGDAAFVAGFCRSLPVPCGDGSEFPGRISGEGVSCRVVTFEKEAVMRAAGERKRGTEEAARFLRYEAFAGFAAETGAIAVCLGHNRNDQLETVLQRFFQGSDISGIRQKRGLFFRPLLDMSRSDIIRYLGEFDVPYRTDITNGENIYLRNRLRNMLVPVLDEVYPGWETGVLTGAEKAAADSRTLRNLAETVIWTGNSDGSVETDAAEFRKLPDAVRLRVLQNGLVRLGADGRVPYRLLKRAVVSRERVSGAGIEIIGDGEKILLKKGLLYRINGGFFAIIKKYGVVDTPFGRIEAVPFAADGGTFPCQGPFRLPLVIRSRRQSDCVETASGEHKTVKKLFCDWKVPAEKRGSVPVIEENGGVRCIWGAVSGFPDWYVRRSFGDGRGEKAYLLYHG